MEAMEVDPSTTKNPDNMNLHKQFLHAVDHNKGDEVAELIDKGVDINAEYGIALYNAVSVENYDMVNTLLKLGANPNLSVHPFTKPLTSACEDGNYKIVEALIKYGADVKFNDNEAICAATNFTRESILFKILEQGASVHDDMTDSAVIEAEDDYLKIVELLIENGADASARNNTPLINAVDGGHESIVEFLLKQGADIRTHDGKPLYLAVKHDHEEMVQILLDHGANPMIREGLPICCDYENNITTESIITISILTMKKTIIKLFIKSNKNLANIIFIRAIVYNNIEMMDFLYQEGADLSYSNNEPIKTAAEKNKIDALRWLIEHGVDFDMDDNLPLKVATRSRIFSIFSYLVSQGAYHEECLYEVAVLDEIKYLETILENGVLGIHKNNALKLAVKAKKLNNIRILLQNFANPNMEDGELVSIAVEDKELGILSLLVKYGANIKAQNNAALRIAISKDDIGLLKAILSLGANLEDINDLIEFVVEKNGEKLLPFLVKEKGIEIPKDNPMILRKAILTQNYKIISFLCEQGICFDDFQSLYNTFKYNLTSIRKLLIEKGTDYEKHVEQILMDAILKNEIRVLELVIKSYPNAVKKYYYSITFAACFDNEKILQLLLENTSIHDKHGEAFLEAVRHDREKNVLLLLKYGININMKFGLPLLIACEKNSVGMVKLLLENGANVNLGHVLTYASIHGLLSIVRLLLKQDITTDSKNEALNGAVMHGQKRIAEVLLKNGAEIGDRANKFLNHSLIQYRYIDMIKLLAEYGANLHGNDDELFINALVYDHIPTLELLMEDGIGIKKEILDTQFKLFVVSSGKLKTIKYLLDHGADINVIDEEILIELASRKQYNVLTFLLEKGVNPNIGNGKVLIYVVENGLTKVFKILTQYGADITIDNYQLIKIAARGGYYDIVSILIEKGSKGLQEAFTETVKSGKNSKIIPLLAKHGIDIHVNDEEALITAATLGHVKVVSRLMKLGANINAQENKAIFSAITNKRKKTVKLLIKDGLFPTELHSTILKFINDSGLDIYIPLRWE